MKIVVRLPNWIGDSILALPALQTFKAALPKAQIWVAGIDWVKDLFVLDGTADGILRLLPTHQLRGLKENVRNLKPHHFDAGLLLTNSFASAFLFYWAKIPERWGYDTDGRGLLLTTRVRAEAAGGPRHQVDYYLHLVSRLGFAGPKPEFKFSIPQEIKESADRLLRSLDVNPQAPLVILCPGAAYGPAKRWPAERFARVGSLFQKEKNAQILLIGSAAEAGIAAAVSSAMERKPCNLAGQTTLPQLIGLISRASLFIANDTGPMHIANALRVPVVAIFGPTDPAVTGPYEQPSRVVKSDVPCWPCTYRECPYGHGCMTAIRAEDVYRAGESMWR